MKTGSSGHPSSSIQADHSRFYRSQTVWKSPTCIILAENSKDVALAIKTIRFFRIKFAIRSGGHSPNPDASSIDEPGLLIDLSKLNEISVSPDKKVATVGPGVRWGDVYAFLDPYKLSVIGGRIPSVGVGGLVLGGGFFHFSGEYGLAADNVKNFEVVLADGRIVNANARENTDLFWALKGGGPNFGDFTRTRDCNSTTNTSKVSSPSTIYIPSPCMKYTTPSLHIAPAMPTLASMRSLSGKRPVQRISSPLLP